ncbi:hypothetical protein AB0I55_13730 [Actinocatenispora sera]|uniref:hypothetical protein n=1 Tax=Actinocatenispora sera TaxID=390989 RepID=UPI0033CB954F
MAVHDPVTRDVLAIFEAVRCRLFERLEGLTDDEYLWEPVGDSLSIRPDADGVFRVAEPIPESAPGVPDPVATIAWRSWHTSRNLIGTAPAGRCGLSVTAAGAACYRPR